MRYGQGRSHGDADFQKGNLRFRRNGKYEGNQQYETDFVKQGDTDDKARQANSPLNIFTTEDVDKRRRNTLSTAAFGHQFTQDGTEANNNGQAAQGSAQPFFNGRNELGNGQSFGYADKARNE